MSSANAVTGTSIVRRSPSSSSSDTRSPTRSPQYLAELRAHRDAGVGDLEGARRPLRDSSERDRPLGVGEDDDVAVRRVSPDADRHRAAGFDLDDPLEVPRLADDAAGGGAEERDLDVLALRPLELERHEEIERVVSEVPCDDDRGCPRHADAREQRAHLGSRSSSRRTMRPDTDARRRSPRRSTSGRF